MTPPQKRPIIIVDDEQPYVVLMAQRLSEHLDCGVHPFTRPAAALEALGHLNPAVIVTDYFMPQINGLEFIRRAEKLSPQASFILITGHPLAAVEDELAVLASLKGRLQKPFRWRELAQVILRVWPGKDVPVLSEGGDSVEG